MGLLCQTLAHAVSQCEEKMDIQRFFFTAKGVKVEAVAQTFSHAEPGKQDVLMSVSVPSYVNMI